VIFMVSISWVIWIVCAHSSSDHFAPSSAYCRATDWPPAARFASRRASRNAYLAPARAVAYWHCSTIRT
jgi:hypothetical protein